MRAPHDAIVAEPPVESMDFGGLTIQFDARVLRPRPWTQQQSRLAAELLARAPHGPVLELCSGAGQIGLLTVLGIDRQLVLVDADPVACSYARRNAAAAGRSATTEVRCAPLTAALQSHERFALIVADPPWVESDRTSNFPEDPLTAIDGGRDGLDIARDCLQVGASHLLPGGVLILQVGSEHQAEQVTGWLEGNPDLPLAPLDVHDVPGKGTLAAFIAR